MAKRIKALFRIFKNEHYRDDFKAGHLYFNTLEYFKNIEDTQEFCIADKCEGAIGFFQPDKIKMRLAGIDIIDLAGPVIISEADLNYCNVLCMTSINDGLLDINKKYTLEEIRTKSFFSDKTVSMGDFAICIINTSEFIQRIETVAKKCRYKLIQGLVEYYDSQSFSGNFEYPNNLFYKRNEFSYQREYRIVLEKIASEKNPIILDVGDISSICMDVHTQEINNLIQFEAKV